MKTKILLSSVLIAILPFTANATDRIGPLPDESDDYVVANDGGPYQTTELLPGDTTNVVSASYVKGAYNDTIAAINLLSDVKQNVLVNYATHENMDTTVLPANAFVGDVLTASGDLSVYEQHLVSANAVVAGIKSQRVTAVDTWGSTHTVDLGLKTAQ